MLKIAVVGHICLDVIPQWGRGVRGYPLPGHLIITGGIKFSPGGCVSNTGISLQRLGTEPILVGKIGDDVIGRLLIDLLKPHSRGSLKNLIVSKGDYSSYTLVLSPPGLDRAFLHYPGANDTFCMQDIDFNELKDAEIFHFGYPPLMKSIYQSNGEELAKIFKRVKRMGMLTSLDMAMPDPDSEAGEIDWRKFLINVLPYTDIFLPSVDELLYMVGLTPPLTTGLLLEISDQLIAWGAKIIMIKLSKDGIYFRTRNLERPVIQMLSDEWSEREFISPAFDVKVAGTTGAGDASVAGFLMSLAEEMSPVESVTIASAVGAFCIETVDSTSGIRPFPEVLKRIKKGWKRLPVEIQLDSWEKVQSGVLLSPRDRNWRRGK